MNKFRISKDKPLEYDLYPVQEVKHLYMIKAQYKYLLNQLEIIQKENMILRRKLYQYQSQD